MTVSDLIRPRQYPEPRAMLRLIKPITWFPPIWAFLCGAVSSAVPLGENWPMVVLGMVLAGPIVCGMSQAANDWCDRHVDAVNEPHRPIPPGRIPGLWGLWIALAMSAAAQRTDRPAAVNVAALAQTSFVIFLLGPPLLGWVAEVWHIRASFGISLPLIALSFWAAKALKN